MRWGAPALVVAVACAASGCGLDVQSADLFVLTRTGQGATTTLLVSDGGTASCDGAKPRALADRLLLQARDLVTSLDDDAKRHLSIRSGPRSVYRYHFKLQAGTVAFPDTAGRTHQELSQAELFAVQAIPATCRSGTP